MTYNVQQLGSAGTHAAGIIPEDEQGRKAGINDYVTQQFANEVMPKFRDIAAQGMNEIFSRFLANTKVDTQHLRLKLCTIIFPNLFLMTCKSCLVTMLTSLGTETLNGDLEKAQK